MKRLDKYILKSYLGPWLLTFSIAIFVLLLQFLWKKIEQIVGKGLEWSVILEMITYACATLVPMALPLSILLASIMTMGNFGERYELVAMKSSGLSLWRILRPLIVLSICFCGIAFYFSNNVIPDATGKLKVLMYEIKTKKPALNIQPDEFYTEIENYTIRIGAKDKTGQYLKDIIIYDHSKDLGNTTVNIADSGQMFTSKDGNTLIFKLFSGYTFDEDLSEENRNAHPLVRMDYQEQTIRFDISDFAYQKADQDRYEGHHTMLNALLLSYERGYSLGAGQTHYERLEADARYRINLYATRSLFFRLGAGTFSHRGRDCFLDYDYFKFDYLSEGAKQFYQNEIANYETKLKSDEEYINKHKIEFHRKFTLSAACLILFFIGAPLGAIIRKGGLGMPVVVSTLAFIIYHIVGQVGENAALEGGMPIWLGMWLSSLIFLPIGIVLTMKATSDSAVLSSEGWTKFFERIKQFTKTKKTKQDNENTASLL